MAALLLGTNGATLRRSGRAGSYVAKGLVRQADQPTIEIVANQQPDALSKQQRGV